MMAKKNKDYEVGFGKPPKSGQFKKGLSGNPRGRKKGARGLKTDLSKELKETVTITENGKPVKISKKRLMVKQLVAKALKGDIRALSKLIDLNISVLGIEDEAIKGPASMSIGDQAILDELKRRLKEEGAADDG